MSVKPPTTPAILLPTGGSVITPPARTCAYCGRRMTNHDAARGECAGCGAPVLIGPREEITADMLMDAVARAKGTKVWM